MVSNLVTPPDIINNGLHSVLLVDPDKEDLDATIKFCQYSEQAFNVYVYTPNMDNLDWLTKVVQSSDANIVNTRSEDYKNLWLLDNTYYYGPRIFIENPRRLIDPIHYFAKELQSTK